jgi:gluconate 2-dehydrogenase gamma chain
MDIFATFDLDGLSIFNFGETSDSLYFLTGILFANIFKLISSRENFLVRMPASWIRRRSSIAKEMQLDSNSSEEINEVEFSRREALKAAATGLLASLPLTKAFAKPISHGDTKKKKTETAHYTFLQKNEAVFIEAAIARLIPADERWGGALEAGVANYMDLQLGGSWGAGERLYRSGPWSEGTKQQGYQLPFTPAELFRTAIRAIDKDLKSQKTTFAEMVPEKQDAYLRELETKDKDLDGVPSKTFFSSLWQMTVEGFFSDPNYGGNRNMIGWKMIGFPGAYASYYDLVDKHGIKINRQPMSLAQDSAGHMHLHPHTPAR